MFIHRTPPTPLVYSQERVPGANFIDVEFRLRGKAFAEFLSGNTYVKITSLTGPEDRPFSSLAKAVAANLGERGAFPLCAASREGKVKIRKVHCKKILGYPSALGFTAITTSGKNFRLFIMKGKIKRLQGMLEKYWSRWMKDKSVAEGRMPFGRYHGESSFAGKGGLWASWTAIRFGQIL